MTLFVWEGKLSSMSSSTISVSWSGSQARSSIPCSWGRAILIVSIITVTITIAATATRGLSVTILFKGFRSFIVFTFYSIFFMTGKQVRMCFSCSFGREMRSVP